jgi:phosphocarrier protein HPr
MPEIRVVIASRVGLHARPAAVFARAAAESGMPVTLTSPSGVTVNAASILAVLSLGIDHGHEVTLSAEGDGAEAALDRLVAILSTVDDEE